MSEKSYTPAIDAFTRSIRYCPSNGPAHFNKAMAHQQLFDFEEAITSFRTCLTIEATRNEAAKKIVPLLLKDQHDLRAKEALKIVESVLADSDMEQDHYTQLLELKAATHHRLKNYESVHSIYASILDILKKRYHESTVFDVAADSKSKDIIHTQLFRAYQNAASAAEGMGDLKKAEEYFLEALATDEGAKDANTWTKYGTYLKYAGRETEAIAALQKAIQIDPDEIASETSYGVIQLAALVGGLDRSSMGEKYIEDLFNGYANRFEVELCDKLNYKGHEHVCTGIKKCISDRDKGYKINVALDLGCGTGLCGPLLREITRCKTLIGVDLSPQMLSKALLKKKYTRLVVSGILDFLRDDVEDHSVDLIVAADVFIYVGKLDEIFYEASRVLSGGVEEDNDSAVDDDVICRDGGLFVFTLEDLEDGAEQSNIIMQDTAPEISTKNGYYLLSNGRFAHSKSYIRELAEKNQSKVIQVKSEVLRIQNETPVRSLTVVLQKSQFG